MPHGTNTACDLSTPNEVALFRSLSRPSLIIHTISLNGFHRPACQSLCMARNQEHLCTYVHPGRIICRLPRAGLLPRGTRRRSLPYGAVSPTGTYH
jgi:hypothetical protein